MDKIVFELNHEKRKIGYLRFGAKYDHGDIATCNLWNHHDYYPERIATFDNEADAAKALRGYKCSKWTMQGQLGTLLFAEDYWISKVKYTRETESDDWEKDQELEGCWALAKFE